MLNRKKGPAVWGYRAQIDRDLYKQHLQEELFNNTPNLDVLVASVEDLIVENLSTTCCSGIILKDGTRIKSKAVVITTGTFLKGQINIGTESRPAGRMGDAPAIGLAETLSSLGLKMGRLKTGTPPRLKADTIDYSVCDRQLGDNPPSPFSFMNDRVWIKVSWINFETALLIFFFVVQPEDQLICYLTRTTLAMEDIIKNNMHLNPHFCGELTGPRYCPSIEAKVLRFGGRRHPVWLEPEGLHSDVVYPNGISCTLPPNLQEQLVRSIPGLEKAEIVQLGEHFSTLLGFVKSFSRCVKIKIILHNQR